MIRVNLRKGGQIGQQIGGTQIGYTPVDDGSVDASGLILRVLILLIVPSTFIYIETANLNRLEDNLRAVNSQVSQVQGEVTGKQNELTQNKDLQGKAKELSNKLQVLTKLSKLRLREVKSLDYIQSIIPEKVWLNELKMEQTKLELKGAALTDDDLTNFIKGLENSAFFANVLLVQAVEQKTQLGTVRQFEISSGVEGAE